MIEHVSENAILHVESQLQEDSRLIEEVIEHVEVSEQGPAGPGIPGAREFPFITASAVWTVNHGLGFKPQFQIVDLLRYGMSGDWRHVDDNTIEIVFSVPLSGYVLI